MVVARGVRVSGDVGELPASVVAIERVGPVVRDKEVEIAVVVVVGHARPDPAVDERTPAAVHPQLLRDIGEASAVVAEEPVQVAILVGDKRVEVAIAVHVEPRHAHRLPRIGQPDLRGYLGVRATVVAEHRIRAIAERHEEVGVAVVVVVEERRLAGRAELIDPEAAADVDERLPAVIAVHPVGDARRARVSHEQVGIAVIVVVTPGRDADLVAFRQPDLGRDVDERAGVIPIEAAQLAAESHEQVEVAIAVVVGPRVRLPALHFKQRRLHGFEELLDVEATVGAHRIGHRASGRRHAVADRLQHEAVRRHFFDLPAAEGHRNRRPLAPRLRQVLVVRAERLRGVAGHAEAHRPVPVLHVEHERERRARGLLRVRLARARRRHHREAVAAATHGIDLEDRARAGRPGQWVHEIGRVQVAPPPRGHVVALLLGEIGHGLRQRLDEDGIACLCRLRAVGPVGLLHPRDDAPHVVLRHACLRGLGCARRVREGPQLEREVLVDRGRHRVLVEHMVPAEQEVACLRDARVGDRQPLEQRHEGPRRQRDDVLLERRHVGNTECLLLAEHLVHAVVPVGCAVLVPERDGVAWHDLRHDIVVRRVVEPLRRVEVLGQRVVGHVAGPLVLAVLARHGQQAIPVLANGRLRDPDVAIIAIDIGVHERVRRDEPRLRERVVELLPVPRLHHVERAEIARPARLGANPAQRERARPLRVLVEHRPVPRELVLDDDGLGLALHPDQLLLDLHVLPLAVGHVAIGVLRIGFFDIEILLVHAQDGEAPRQAVVVTDRDPWQARLGGADRAPAGRLEVHDVTQRGVHHLAVRVVGDDGLAGGRLVPADDPVVRAEIGLGEPQVRAHACCGHQRAIAGLSPQRRRGLACVSVGEPWAAGTRAGLGQPWARRVDAGRRRSRRTRRSGRGQVPAQVVGLAGDVEDAGLDVVEVEAGRHGEPLFGIGGLELEHLVDAHGLDVEGALHLARRVARQRPPWHARQHGLGRPHGLRPEPHDRELDGDLVLVDRLLDRGVDAARERVEYDGALGMVAAELLVPVPSEGEQARESIARHVGLAEHLGQSAFAVAAPHLELPHPVLGDDVALGEEQVVRVLCVDMRNAPLVAQHLDGLAQAVDHDRPIELGERRPGGWGQVWGLRRRRLRRQVHRSERHQGGDHHDTSCCTHGVLQDECPAGTT